MHNKTRFPKLQLSSPHPTSWLLSLPQPSSFTLEKSFSGLNFPSVFPRPLSNSHPKNQDLYLNFPSDTVTKPFTYSDRWLWNANLPVQENFSPDSSQGRKKHKKRKKKKKIERKIKNIVKRHALGFSTIENLDFFKHYYRLLIKNIFILHKEQKQSGNITIDIEEKRQKEEKNKEKEYIPLTVRNFFLQKTKQDLLFFEKLIQIYEKNDKIGGFLGFNEYIDSNKFDKISDKLSFLPRIEQTKNKKPMHPKKRTSLRVHVRELTAPDLPYKERKMFKEDDFLRNLLKKMKRMEFGEITMEDINGLKEIVEEKKLILKGMEEEFRENEEEEKKSQERMKQETKRNNPNNVESGVKKMVEGNALQKPTEEQIKIPKKQETNQDLGGNAEAFQNKNIKNSADNITLTKKFDQGITVQIPTKLKLPQKNTQNKISQLSKKPASDEKPLQPPSQNPQKPQILKKNNKSSHSSKTNQKPSKTTPNHHKLEININKKSSHQNNQRPSPSNSKPLLQETQEIIGKKAVITEFTDYDQLQTLETQPNPSKITKPTENRSQLYSSASSSVLKFSSSASLSRSSKRSDSHRTYRQIQSLLKAEQTSPLLKKKAEKPNIIRVKGNPNNPSKSSIPQKVKGLSPEPSSMSKINNTNSSDEIVISRKNIPPKQVKEQRLDTSFSSVASSMNSIRMKAISQGLYQEFLSKFSVQNQTENSKIDASVHKTSIESHFNLTSKRIIISNRMTLKDFENHQLESLLEQNLVENNKFLENIQQKLVEETKDDSDEKEGKFEEKKGKLEAKEGKIFEEKEGKTEENGNDSEDEESEDFIEKIEEKKPKKKEIIRRTSLDNLKIKSNIGGKFAFPRSSILLNPEKKDTIVNKTEQKMVETLKIPEKVEEIIKENNEKIRKIEEIERNLNIMETHRNEIKEEKSPKDVLDELDSEYIKLQEELGFAEPKSAGKNKTPTIKKLAEKKPLDKKPTSTNLPKKPEKKSESVILSPKVEPPTQKKYSEIPEKSQDSLILNSDKKPEKILDLILPAKESKPDNVEKIVGAKLTLDSESKPNIPNVRQDTSNSSSLPLSNDLKEKDNSKMQTSNLSSSRVEPPKPAQIIENPSPQINPSPILPDNKAKIKSPRKTNKDAKPKEQAPNPSKINNQETPKVENLLKDMIPTTSESFPKIPALAPLPKTPIKSEQKKDFAPTQFQKSILEKRISTFQDLKLKLETNQDFDLDKELSENKDSKQSLLPSQNANLDSGPRSSQIKQKSGFSLATPANKSIVKQISQKGQQKLSVFPAQDTMEKSNNESLNTNRMTISNSESMKNIPKSPTKKATNPLLEEARLHALIAKKRKEEIQAFLRNLEEGIEENVISQNPCIDRLKDFFEETQQSLRRSGKSLDTGHLKFSNQIKNPIYMRPSEFEMRDMMRADREKDDVSDSEQNLPISRVAGDFMGEQMRKKAFRKQKRVLDLVKKFVMTIRSMVKQGNIEESTLVYCEGETLNTEERGEQTQILEESIKVNEEITANLSHIVKGLEAKGGQKRVKSELIRVSEPNTNENTNNSRVSSIKDPISKRDFSRFFTNSKKRLKLKIV